MAKKFWPVITWLIPVTLVLLLLPPRIAAASPGWWSPYWQYRIKLTFDNSASSEDLNNFPALVHLTATHSDFWSHISSDITTDDTKDLRFVDDDDATELYFEAERIDYASQDALIWVNIPQIDAGSTTDFIYVYYGNPADSESAHHSASDVWDSNFLGVWHLGEGVGTTTADSLNQHNGSLVNSPTWVDGQIGNALQFTNAGQKRVEIPDPDQGLNPGYMTAEDLGLLGCRNDCTSALGKVSSYGWFRKSAARIIYGKRCAQSTVRNSQRKAQR